MSLPNVEEANLQLQDVNPAIPLLLCDSGVYVFKEHVPVWVGGMNECSQVYERKLAYTG